MDLKEYKQRALATALANTVCSDKTNIEYPVLGLIGESGEVAEGLKKTLRDDAGVITDKKRESLIKEIGDIMWYVNRIAWGVDIELSDCYYKPHTTEASIYRLARNNHHNIDDILLWLDFLNEPQTKKNLVRIFGNTIETIEQMSLKLNSSLAEICRVNVEKLEDRQKRGVLHGSGSDR